MPVLGERLEEECLRFYAAALGVANNAEQRDEIHAPRQRPGKS